MNTFNQRRSRSGSFAPNDYTPKGKVEAREYREQEAELIEANQARPMPTTYRSLEQVQASRLAAEIAYNQSQALGCWRVGNWVGAKLFNGEALRLEGKL